MHKLESKYLVTETSSVCLWGFSFSSLMWVITVISDLYEEQMDDGFAVCWKHVMSYGGKWSLQSDSMSLVKWFKYRGNSEWGLMIERYCNSGWPPRFLCSAETDMWVPNCALISWMYDRNKEQHWGQIFHGVFSSIVPP